MHLYPARVLERAMKIKEVITRAMSGSINWIQAAEILGMSDRQLRRWRTRWGKHGYDGLYDRRARRPSPKRVSLADAEKVLGLYRERYFDLNVKHFVEKLREEHQIQLSYTWVKTALQTAGLVERYRKRGTHHKKRERKPLPGMMLHVDGSRHQWIPGLDAYQDMIVIFDDATSEMYYARLVDEESTENCDGRAPAGHRRTRRVLFAVFGSWKSFRLHAQGGGDAGSRGQDTDCAGTGADRQRADRGNESAGTGPV